MKLTSGRYPFRSRMEGRGLSPQAFPLSSEDPTQSCGCKCHLESESPNLHLQLGPLTKLQTRMYCLSDMSTPCGPLSSRPPSQLRQLQPLDFPQLYSIHQPALLALAWGLPLLHLPCLRLQFHCLVLPPAALLLGVASPLLLCHCPFPHRPLPSLRTPFKVQTSSRLCLTLIVAPPPWE